MKSAVIRSGRCLVGMGLAATLLLGACSSETGGDGASTDAVRVSASGVIKALPDGAAPLEEQIFRYLGYEPAGLDISMAVYQSGQSEFAFERLCMLDHNNELIPGAADSWKSSEDGRTWTFYLHPGAKWSDGTPVTAHDFEYTYRRLLDPDSGNVYAFFYYDILGAKAFNQRENSDPGSLGIRAVDDLTFVIETERPCAYLPFVTQFPTSSPVPRHRVEKYGRRWTEAGNIVTNSAFHLEEWLTGKHMVFGPNPHYEGNNPAYLQKIQRVFTGPVGAASTTGQVGLLPYENDEVDMVAVTGPADLKRIKDDPSLSDQLWSYDGFGTEYIFFRTQEPPFDDVRVRQAVAHAIDKETIAGVILGGSVLPAYTMLPPHFPGYVGDKYRHLQQYDPDLARQLMTEAGYPEGRGFPAVELWLSDSAPSSPVGQVAQVVQQHLKETLGISISIKNTQSNTYIQSMYVWEIPLSLGGFGYDYPDPQSLLGVVWRSQPKGYTRHDWTNARFDEMIDRGVVELNSEKRFEYYEEAERAIASDVGGAFLWHRLVHDLRKPWVKGLKEDRWGNYPFRGNNTTYCDLYIGAH